MPKLGSSRRPWTRLRVLVWSSGLLGLLLLLLSLVLLSLSGAAHSSASTTAPCQQNCTPSAGAAPLESMSVVSPLALLFGFSAILLLTWLVGSAVLVTRRAPLPPPPGTKPAPESVSTPRPAPATSAPSSDEESDPLSHML